MERGGYHFGRKKRSAYYYRKENMMIKAYVRFCLSLLLAMLIALGAISPAYAAETTTFTYGLQGSQVLADCGSFQVFDDYDITLVRTDFYDNDGQRTQMHVSINGTDTYRQSVTGQSFTMGTHFMIHNDYRAGLFSAMGLQYHLMVPGIGLVLIDAGDLMYDAQVGDYVFYAGPHQVATGDTSGLCSAFD